MRTIDNIAFTETTDPEPGCKAVVTYSDGVKMHFVMAYTKQCDDPGCALSHDVTQQEAQTSLLFGMAQLMEDNDLMETGETTQVVDKSGYTH